MTTIGSFSQPYPRVAPQFGCAARKVGFAGNTPPVNTIGLDVSHLSMPKREALASQLRRAAKGNVTVSEISVLAGSLPQPGKDKHYIAVESLGQTLFGKDVQEKATELAKQHKARMFTSASEIQGDSALKSWLSRESEKPVK